MKFWIVEDKDGTKVSCEATKKKAIEAASKYAVPRDEMEIYWADVNINAETIRRLLGDIGGYANDSGYIC